MSSTSLTLIVPCRNEEQNVPQLLQSLAEFPGEILVVDDSSSDRTAEVSRAFANVRVIHAPSKPDGWVGKSWACWVGAQEARGDLLLFTDADTIHRPQSWQRAVQALGKHDFLSAPPYHRCRKSYEKLLGLFCLLPLIITAYQARPRTNRLFAIGQYLLFRRSAYFKFGGHQAVRSSLAEDVDIAQIGVRNGLAYTVFTGPNLYEVQMYDSFTQFWRGWVRILRVGMRRSSLPATLEVILVFHLFANLNTLMLAGVLAVAWLQRRHGAFSIWGALLAPLSLLLFVAMSVVAVLQSVSKREIVWHDRSYVDS